MRTTLRMALVGAFAAGLVLAPVTAGATPSSGVTAKILAQHTVGGKDYVLREITIAPGGGTGWHFHDGTLYALVKTGTLTHNAATCAIDGVYRKGSAFVEPSNEVHIGRNLSSAPLVLEVLYVNPAGSPLSQDAPNPGCDFQ